MSLPVLYLDDVTFADLVEEAVRLIPQYAPGWTDHNLSDPGITFMDLFAWLAEMQIYSLNQITPRHHLKYLRLLGVRPEPAAAARVWVTFSHRQGTVCRVPRGTNVATSEGVAFETDSDIDVLPVSLDKVISFDRRRFFDHSDTNRRTGVFYHAFGEKAAVGAGLYIGFSFAGEMVEGNGLKAAVAGKELRLKVHLYEDDLPPVVEPGAAGLVRVSVNVCWKYWSKDGWQEFEPLAEAGAGLVKNLLRSGGLTFKIPAGMEKKELFDFGSCFWIYAGLVVDGYEIPPRLDTLLLNTVPATQGVTTEEMLGASLGLPVQEFEVDGAPVLAGSQALQVENGFSGWEEWTAVDDMDASLPEDRHYLLDCRTGKITFGDGINGMIPPAGRKIKFIYRSGGGSAGNAGAGTVTLVYGVPEVAVTNVFPADGGKEAENIEAARFRFNKHLKEATRAVTAEDFSLLALKTPGLRVARAKALVEPGRNVVRVVVVPFSMVAEPVPGRGFLHTVKEHLSRRRLITTLVEVVAPRYMKVSVFLKVRATPGSDPALVRERVVEALNGFLHPLKGGPDGKGWEFGREVYRSELYAFLTGIDGVDCVTDLTFTLDGRMDETCLICSGRHMIEVVEPETVCGGKFDE
jgi:hypothetical protein